MPAAAVIPAPIAYIKVVAVKKLVVGFWTECWSVCRKVCTDCRLIPSSGDSCVLLTECAWGSQDFYFEKIRVFKAGVMLEYISME